MSPSLISREGGYEVAPSESLSQWLRTLDRNPEPIYRDLQNLKTTRLGHRFEFYWQFYWLNFTQTNSDYRFNIQLHNRDGVTLGEMDMLEINTDAQKATHCEMALKFYLVHQNKGLLDYLGPGTNDRLTEKLNHLFDHQLAMSASTEAASKYPDWNIKKQPTTKHLLRGRLYYPIDGSIVDTEAFTDLESNHNWTLNRAHLKGYWIKPRYLELLSRHINQGEYWVILDRKEWMAPIQIEKSERCLSQAEATQELSLHYTQNAYPIQVAKVAPKKNSPTVLEETLRILMIPDQWPETT